MSLRFRTTIDFKQINLLLSARFHREMPKHTEKSLILWTLGKNLCSVNPTETEDQDSSRDAQSLMDNMELSCTSNWVPRIKCSSWRCCVSVLLDRAPSHSGTAMCPAGGDRTCGKSNSTRSTTDVAHQQVAFCGTFFFLVLLWKQWLLLSIFQTQTLLYSLVCFSNNCLSRTNPLYWDSETSVEVNTPAHVHACTHTCTHSRTKQNNRTALYAQLCLRATGLNDSDHLQIRMKGSYSFQNGHLCWIDQRHCNMCFRPWCGLSKRRRQPCPSFLPGSRCLVILLSPTHGICPTLTTPSPGAPWAPSWLWPCLCLSPSPRSRSAWPCSDLPGPAPLLPGPAHLGLDPPTSAWPRPSLPGPAPAASPSFSLSAQTQEAVAGQCALLWCPLSLSSPTSSASRSLSLCSTLFFPLPPLRLSSLLVIWLEFFKSIWR